MVFWQYKFVNPGKPSSFLQKASSIWLYSGRFMGFTFPVMGHQGQWCLSPSKIEEHLVHCRNPCKPLCIGLTSRESCPSNTNTSSNGPLPFRLPSTHTQKPPNIPSFRTECRHICSNCWQNHPSEELN